MQIYPLDAPGFPPVGDDFIQEARRRGDAETAISVKGRSHKLVAGPVLQELVYDALFDRGALRMCVTISGAKKTARPMPIIAGHRWGRDPQGFARGPEPCDVMVIGKMLGDVEVNKRRCMIGPSGQLLHHSLVKLGIPISRWYVTNLLKIEHPDNGNGWRESWVKNFLHLLYQEIALVRPRFILCLGSDALKAILGKRMTQSKAEGRVIEHTFDLRRTDTDPPDDWPVKIMACLHPAAVLRTPEQTDKFEITLARFGQLVGGTRWDLAEDDLDHRVIDNEDDLARLVQEVRAHGTNNIIGMDAEWHGEHPENVNSYVRCVQVSWAHKKAAAIVLHGPGGAPAFRGGIPRAIELLNEMLADMRPCGHFFTADLEWLVPLGLDLRKAFAPPANWWECKERGGLDTAYMAHAVDEVGDFTLTGQALRYTAAPRYDIPLLQWKERYCREEGLRASDLEGYGECPDEILYPYAIYDADVTRRLAMVHMKNLDADRFGNNCWEAFWMSQRAACPILEMKQTGIQLDTARVDELTMLYLTTRNSLEEKIRNWANWPTLNLNSTYHVRELLFGEKFNGKEPQIIMSEETGEVVSKIFIRLRPEEAKSLYAIPVLTTDKRQRKWSELSAAEAAECKPSTNHAVLGMMSYISHELPVSEPGMPTGKRDYHEIVSWLRDHRFIGQIMKSVLRPPDVGEDAQLIMDEDDNLQYSGGLAGSVCDDGMVRTTLYPTKETGRWSSARPPLQNLSQRREPEYKRILGSAYRYPLRSVLCAPRGYALVESDYIGAELFGMAIMAGDPQMIDHALRNQLPEDDPRFYDIHSNIAVMAFQLPCAPTKAGLAALGKKNLRIVAKAVIFGIAYGRGAKAIALAAKEEGIDVSVKDAQRIIDTVFMMYPGLVEFFAECRGRAVTQPKSETPAPRWLCGAFGRFRRFPEVDPNDQKLRGDMERQAQNAPIQGLVADAVAIAAGNLYEYRQNAYDNGWTADDLDYKLCLQVHDSLMSLVRYEHVPFYIDTVLPACMVTGVTITPCFLDGTAKTTNQYTLGIDTGVSFHWGVVPLPDELEEVGIPPSYAHWRETEDGLIHPEAYPGAIWRDGALFDLKARQPT